MSSWLKLVPSVSRVDGPNEACVPEVCFYRVESDRSLLLLRRPFLYLKNFSPPYERVDVLPDDQSGVLNTTFHRWYLQLFDLSPANLPKDAIVVSISDHERAQVEMINAVCRLTGNHVRAIDNNLDELYSLIDRLDRAIRSSLWLRTNGVFVKCQENSTKQQTDPAFTGLEVVQELCKSSRLTPLFRDRESVPRLLLFLLPWNAELVASPEYRLFVYDGAIRTICPQRYYEPCDQQQAFSSTNLTVLENAVNEFQRSFVERLLAHRCCSLDVYLHAGLLHLIEVNGWYNAGTGLLTYQRIIDTPDNVCRYVVYSPLVKPTTE